MMVKFYNLDNIIVGEYDSNLKINLSMAQEVVKLRMEYLKSINLAEGPTLCISNNVYLTSEARRFFSSPSGYEGITRMAFLVNNRLTEMLINFYIKVTTHCKPLKFFYNREEAIKWLNE